MAGNLQLTEQLNPMAQTFRVLEPSGSVITSIGLFFYSAPTVTQDQLPIMIELRPVVEGGNPSSQRFIPGTRVSATAAQIRTKASTTFSDSTEYKFSFKEPVYIPENTEVAIVAYTSAPAGQYKVYAGTLDEYQLPSSNTLKVTHQLDAGVFFQSSNGTAWSKDQNTDIAFKVYRAIFDQSYNYARVRIAPPAEKRLTENRYTENYTRYVADPLILTSSADSAQIIHPAHGFLPGDKVTLSGLDSDTAYGGVFGKSIIGSRTITKADPYGYTFIMDSSADSSGRFGGTDMIATEQYVINDMILDLPHLSPPNTEIYANGSFITHKSFGGTETAGVRTSNVKVPIRQIARLKDPHVILSAENEGVDSSSTYLNISLNTTNKYTAPYINVNAGTFGSISNFIDYQDSASEDINSDGDSDRNTLSTISYVSETLADGGTTASKHLTIPFVLEDDATSIRVIMDARKPHGSDFSVWYRTKQTASDTPLAQSTWTEFSKTINPPNSSNYSQKPISEVYSEFEFNVFDIPSFDEYQIKITFNSTRSSNVPTFQNLRTIATI